MRFAALPSLLAIMLGMSAPAAVYDNYFADPGAVSQGRTSLSFEHALTGNPSSIESIELVLTFSSGYHLDGTSIHGSLLLDPSGVGTSVTFAPSPGSHLMAGTGGQEIYDMTFSSFNSANANNIWALNLWDTGTSGIENGLVSWSLNVTGTTPVPEPVNVALGIFGGICGLVLLARSRAARTRIQQWRVGATKWRHSV